MFIVLQSLTPRNLGQSVSTIISKINGYLDGWFGHFRVCTRGVERVIQGADAHIRRRLRAISLKQWKAKPTIVRRLIRLGTSPKTTWRRVYEGRKSLWALSHDPVVDRGLRNAYFAERGFVTLRERFEAVWAAMVAPRQLSLSFG